MPRKRKDPIEGIDQPSPSMVLTLTFQEFRKLPNAASHLALRNACNEYARTYVASKVSELEAQIAALRAPFQALED